MSEPSSDLIWEYVTWQDGDTWYARRKAAVNAEQAAHGVQEVVTAGSFEDLRLEAIAQRIRATWYR